MREASHFCAGRVAVIVDFGSLTVADDSRRGARKNSIAADSFDTVVLSRRATCLASHVLGALPQRGTGNQASAAIVREFSKQKEQRTPVRSAVWLHTDRSWALSIPSKRVLDSVSASLSRKSRCAWSRENRRKMQPGQAVVINVKLGDGNRHQVAPRGGVFVASHVGALVEGKRQRCASYHPCLEQGEVGATPKN